MHGYYGPSFGFMFFLAICAIIALKSYFRWREKEAEFGRRDDMVSQAEFDACKDKLDKMEERMRVLERIVTNKRDRLARELSELED